MKAIISLALSLLLLTFAAGCGGDSYDKVGADMLRNTTARRDVLKTVTDPATANAAAAPIKSLAAEMQSIRARLNTLGKPSKEIGDELNAKYQLQIQQAEKEIQEQLARISALGPTVSLPVEAALLAPPGK